MKYLDPSGFKALESWKEFWDIVNDLWDKGGGCWNSGSEANTMVDGTDHAGGGSGSSAGGGLSGGYGSYYTPIPLGEVTVTAKKPYNKPNSPIINNDYDPFRWDNHQGGEDPNYFGGPSGGGVGEPGFSESLIPVWGSGRSAINAFQNGNYWTSIGYGVLTVTDVFLVKAAVTAVAKGTVTLAAKYCLREAVANPTLTAREAAAAIRNPALEAIMNGKGVDRAFRAAASNNLILRPAESIGILQIGPMNRGADMAGRGILQGTWWDVTTSGSWGAHVAKYGSGGIPLIYP